VDLTFWDRVSLVARREMRERTRQRSFAISTVISLLILVGLAVLPKLLDRPTKWKLGGTDAQALGIAETARDLLVASEPDARVTIVPFDTEAAGRQAIRSGKISTLIIGRTPEPILVVDRRVGDQQRAIFDAAIQRQRITAEAARLGITDADALALAAPGRFTIDAINPPDKRREGDLNIARAAGIIMFMQVLQFGMAVATGVIEEKSSRVLELLLGRMRPSALLTGKLLGIGAVGLGQTALFIAVGLSTVAITGTVTLTGTSLGLGIALLGWFLLGYGLYSALFLMAGAVAGRQEDLQNTSGPAMTVAMLSYFGSVISASAPESAGSRIVSLIPFAAPMAMPVRMASGDATIVEVLFAVVVTAATVVGLVVVASRVYERTTLATTQQGLFRVLRGGRTKPVAVSAPAER
jgi:ABC-2 type transport system permease protein